MTPPPGPEVFKFGGTSLGDADRILHVAELVAREPSPPVVVVSALAGVTDRLAALCALSGPSAREQAEALSRLHHAVLAGLGPPGGDRDAVAGEVDRILGRLGDTTAEDASRPEGCDAVLATGEDLSARLVSFALRTVGRASRVVDAREVVRTDDRFGRARPLEEAVREPARARLLPLLGDGVVPVLQGFVGATLDGRTTTLGRGGSDFTAAILGAALDARRVHVWTDVDGILSGDPRAVEEPRILERVGFEEAVELSYFGAKVIHPGAAKHAVSHGVPLHVRNSFRPDGPGTLILRDRWGGAGVVAVAYKPRVALIKVRSHPSSLPYGFLARVFEILARHRLPVDLVATSHSSTAFTLDEHEELGAVSTELAEFAEVEVIRDLATVTVVGHGLLDEPGVDGLVFREVGTTPVHLISQASDVSLSFLVAADDAPPVVRRLHRALVRRDRPGEGGGSARSSGASAGDAAEETRTEAAT